MLKGWTEEEHAPNQAHPHSADQFDAFLRRRAQENLIDIYLYERRPLWRRIDWLGATLRVALVGIAIASWAMAASSIGALLGIS